ncbi:MAG TPA: hypothetical protein VGJ00_05120 [Rhabdochlamydiaceae bacterium]|jgi:protein-L-isoaspartate O-methyltransferase
MEKEILNTTPAFCSMEYVTDSLGREVLLKEGRYQVMMEWEKPYMQACINALRPFGDVLEVGFGCGYSATHIQTYQPKSHTIIEYHPTIAERARFWAKDYSHVTIIEDTWQNALPKLGVYDCIFFDDYPLESPEYFEELEKQVSGSSSLLKEGQEFLFQVEKQLPFLTSLKYSRQDIEDLLAQLSQNNPDGKQLHCFLEELKQREQITPELCRQMQQLLVERGWLSKTESEKMLVSSMPARKPQERLMRFLSQCLAHHMRKGSRFSCFLSDPLAPWENERFFHDIIANPHIEYREQHLDVDVPENCTYYAKDKALVITVEKMD